MPVSAQVWEDTPRADRHRHETRLIIWWREIGNKHTNKQTAKKATNSAIISMRERERIVEMGTDRDWRGSSIGGGEDHGLHSECKGYGFGGSQTEEGHDLIYRKMLWPALWKMGFRGVKVKDKAGRPAEGMVSSRTEVVEVERYKTCRKKSRTGDYSFLTWDIKKEKDL